MHRPTRFARDDIAIRIEPLADLTLAYHRRSGATLILSPESEAIMTALADGPADIGEILERLTSLFDRLEAEPGIDIERVIESRLTGLREAGLVYEIDA